MHRALICAASLAQRWHPTCATTLLAARRAVSTIDSTEPTSSPPSRRRHPAFPAAPTWSLAELRPSAVAPLSDADVLRVARLSHLAFEPGKPAFDEIKADLSAVLATTVEVAAHAAAARAAAAARRRGGGDDGVGSGRERQHGEPASAGASGPTAEQDAEAEARLLELRPDGVREGGDAAAVLRHAARVEGAYFTVPKVLADET